MHWEGWEKGEGEQRSNKVSLGKGRQECKGEKGEGEWVVGDV